MRPAKASMPELKKLYLLFYNFVSFAGWTTVLFKLILHFVSPTSTDLAELVGWVQILHVTMCLEIVHAALGVVRSAWHTAFMQIFSRWYISWAILGFAPDVAKSWIFIMMVASWSITEVIRFGYFVLMTLDALPAWFGKIRYSTFFLLYPTGAGGEVLLAILGFGALARLPAPTVSWWPNMLLGLSLYGFNWFFVLCYLPGLPFMYRHMIIQRRKFLRKLKAGQ
eukprot:gnl/Trimastix_PCT/1927.p2 GENE.gnl/Trimastix_PCT/1927~~gnl/Trimastix_PCT/1927.p2  ORF type:complete len:224 (+),score=67.40 gnl/Trimastix_PCT/1927:27-698(+)